MTEETRLLEPSEIDRFFEKHKIPARGDSLGAVIRPLVIELLITQDAKSYCIGVLDGKKIGRLTFQ